MSEPVPRLTVVHLDDNPLELEAVRAELEAEGSAPGLVVHSLSDPAGLAEILEQTQPDIVLLDLHLEGAAGDEGGLALVPICRRLAPGAALVMLSASDEPAAIRTALTAAGVDDYLTKDTAKSLGGTAQGTLRRLLVETWGRVRRRAPPERLTAAAGAQPAPGEPMVAGRTLRAIRTRVPAIIASALNGVHVHGESGTGKEVVAQLFRAAVLPKPFLSVNCGAISPSLLESTLFGVVRGSYTGATTDRKGYLEAASGGWLFLDEVACLSPPAQAALLRAIESQEILRVGDNRPIRIDVRLVTATNEDLSALVAAGRFRLDLWQRLAEVELKLPPLRERPDEIHELLDHLAAALPGGPYVLASAARTLLARLPWREGNVRQLRNCLRAMTERRVGRTLTPQAIPAHYLTEGAAGSDAEGKVSAAAAAALPRVPPLAIQPPASAARPYAFNLLTVRLFLETVKALGRSRGRLSVRQLAGELEVSKSSVSRKLWEAIGLGLVTPEELRDVVRLERKEAATPAAPAGEARGGGARGATRVHLGQGAVPSRPGGLEASPSG